MSSSYRQAIFAISWLLWGVFAHAQTLRTLNLPNQTTNTFAPTWTPGTWRAEFRIENAQASPDSGKIIIWGNHPSGFPSTYCAVLTGTTGQIFCTSGDGAGNGNPTYTFANGDDLRIRFQRDTSASPPLLTLEVWKGNCSGYTFAQKSATSTGSTSAVPGIWLNSGSGSTLKLAVARNYSTTLYGGGCPADAPTAHADLWDFRFEGDVLTDTSGHAYTMTAPSATFSNSAAYPPIAVIDGWSTYLPVGTTGNAFQLNGTHSVTSVGFGVPASYAWSQTDGPGTLTFSNTSVASPTVTTSTPGDYTVKLVVTDSASNTANVSVHIGMVTVNANNVVQNSGEFYDILGPVVAHGSSPWPWYDVTEAAVEASVATGWATPPTLSPGCGTATLEYPPNEYVGSPYFRTQGPSGNQIVVKVNGCTITSAIENNYGYIGFTDTDGTVVHYPFYIGAGYVIDSTHFRMSINYVSVPQSILRGTLSWGTMTDFNPGWYVAGYSNNWNFYEAGLGAYRMWARTGLTKYRDDARTLCTNWYGYALGGGYQPQLSLNNGLQFIMACAADNHSTWWDNIAAMTIGEGVGYGAGGISPSPITQWNAAGYPVREAAYVTRHTALVAKYYPAHTANPSTTRSTWCGYLAAQINNYWAWGTTINSGQDFFWQEDAASANATYPYAADPVGSPTGTFGTSPWRNNGLATLALQYAWESLSDSSVCNDSTTANVLYKASDSSGIIPKAANFVWDYGRTPGGGVYYQVLSPTQGYVYGGSNILYSWSATGSLTTVSGSTAIVGNGNTFFTKAMTADGHMQITAQGDTPRDVRISSVTDDTHLTLAAPFPGLSGSYGTWTVTQSIAVTANSTAVVGTNTKFTSFFGPCDGSTYIEIKGTDITRVYQVTSCANDSHLTINVGWGGATQNTIYWALTHAAPTNCLPSIAAWCEADYYDNSGRSITSDVAAGQAWLYAKTLTSTWKDRALYFAGKIFGGYPGASGSTQGSPTGPYADGGVGSLGYVLPSCQSSAPPCGQGLLDGFKGKYFGMAVGAGDSPAMMANILSSAATARTIAVDFVLASVPNATKVRVTLKKSDGSVSTAICLTRPCQIAADANMNNPHLTLEYLATNGTVLAVRNGATITWSSRSGENAVIPLAVERGLLQVEPCHLLIWDCDACWIDRRIKLGLDSQSGFGCGVPDQVHDHLVAF